MSSVDGGGCYWSVVGITGSRRGGDHGRRRLLGRGNLRRPKRVGREMSMFGNAIWSEGVVWCGRKKFPAAMGCVAPQRSVNGGSLDRCLVVMEDDDVDGVFETVVRGAV